MSSAQVNVFIDDDDEIGFDILDTLTLAISLGSRTTIYVDSSSRHYYRLRGMFDSAYIQKETAPGVTSPGDGSTDAEHTPE